jgi:hypothetical protein
MIGRLRRGGTGSPLAWLRVLGAVAWAAMPAARGVAAQTSPTSEYELKAVFLFNFAQFVEWPATAFPEPQAPLVIGVLGEDPFGPYLDATVQGEAVNEHPLVVHRFHRVEDITTCHILFVSRPEQGRVEKILAALKGRGILTVGDIEGFAGRGGMISFVTDHNRIRLRINLDAARADDLTISSKLLRPAEIVSTASE